MYRVITCHKFIFVIVDEVNNYLVTIPLYRGTSDKTSEACINHVFCIHGPPSYLFFWDKEQAFLSSVMQHIYKRLEIKIKTTSPYNNFSLKTARHIRTISEMTAKTLVVQVKC